jgi:hypothetical protein
MDEMRSEIRAAFEREQAAHPPVAGLRHNMVEAVSARQRPAPNFQWVAVAAAVILGVLVVVGLMSTRFHPRATVPAATPNASPLADYGPPPAGVSLIYVHDPNHPSWLIGYDWSGTPRGTVKPDQAIDPNQLVAQAPDGQSFQVMPTAKGGSGVFLDRLGAVISSPGNAGVYTGGVWADDNRHFCSVSFDQQTYVWALVTQGPGEAQKQVAVIARDTGVGQTGIGITGCSYKHDQAVVVRTTIAWPSEMWVMQISTGKVLSHTNYTDQPSNLVASSDTLFIGENSGVSTALQQPGSSATVIRRVSDGSVVASLDPSMGVLAFSYDNSLVLVTTSPWVQGQPAHIAIVDVKTQQVVWRYDGPYGLGRYLVEQPDSQGRTVGLGFALALKFVPPTATPCGATPQTACRAPVEDPLSDILIVHGNGSLSFISGRNAAAW